MLSCVIYSDLNHYQSLLISCILDWTFLILIFTILSFRNSEDSDSPYMRNIKFVDDMVKENQDNLLFSVEEFKANREVCELCYCLEARPELSY